MPRENFEDDASAVNQGLRKEISLGLRDVLGGSLSGAQRDIEKSIREFAHSEAPDAVRSVRRVQKLFRPGPEQSAIPEVRVSRLNLRVVAAAICALACGIGLIGVWIMNENQGGVPQRENSDWESALRAAVHSELEPKALASIATSAATHVSPETNETANARRLIRVVARSRVAWAVPWIARAMKSNPVRKTRWCAAVWMATLDPAWREGPFATEIERLLNEREHNELPNKR